MDGVVRCAVSVASGATGSWSIPSAACSAGVTCFWNTGPPLSPSSSHTPPRYAVAWTSTSSPAYRGGVCRSEEHTSELQSRLHLVCRLLLEKKKTNLVYL